MSTDKNIVIFAPHVDDELIGCFELLKAGRVDTVVYFDEWQNWRKTEAEDAAKYFGFKPHFASLTEGLPLGLILDQHVLVLPHIKDSHWLHKKVNVFGKTQYPRHRKQYYSVDMNVSLRTLDESSMLRKKDLLFELYPSQAAYFTNNQQSYLFESLVDSDIETTITVKTAFRALHCYPEAPDEVSYLRNLHRHNFNVELTFSVFHDNRDREFFMVQADLDKFIERHVTTLDNKSCEMICKTILQYALSEYPDRDFYEVKVSEDNENGATVTFRVR
jgi:hypothetical protein